MRVQLYLAGASLAALGLAVPAAAQTVPEPQSGPPQGTVTTGAGDSAPQGKSGDAQSGTTQSAQPSSVPQSTATETSNGDIIVTAQRRSEALQQVPIAVSAFTGQALERQQISNASDLQLSLPNVTFTKTNFTSSSFTIRGIGDLCTGFSCDQATGIHVNDMPLVSTRLFETEYFDLERVEVLRGPQGTLFGRNATSGVVNFITARPNLTKVATAASLEYGNYQSLKATGMINVPLTDTLGIRAAGYFLTRDGYTKNIFNNSRVDGRDLWAVRGSLRWKPSAGTTLDVIGYAFNENDDRSRIQKQLCHRDPTGVLGCLPDTLPFEIVNGKSTLSATLSSRQFINAAAGFNPLVAGFGLGLVDLNNAADPFFGGITNPQDLRTISADFNPTYKAKEYFVMGRLEQDLGETFSATVTGGWAKNSVDSRTDYNLLAGNSLAGNPGLVSLYQLSLAPGAIFPGGVNPFTNAARALIPNGPLGSVCTSETNLNYTGIYGGFTNRCTPGSTDYDRSQSNYRQYSVEAHVDSNFNGPFNFLLGGIYLDGRFTNSNYYVASAGLDYASGVLGAIQSLGQRAAGATFPNTFLAPPFFNSEVSDFRLKSYGVFGEAYFQASDKLKFTLGARYSNDRKRQVARAPILSWLTPFGVTDANQSPFIGLYDADASTPGNQANAIAKVRFGRVTGRLVADYQMTPNNLLYASYSRGYKSGGINPPIDPSFNVSPTFRPESIDSFEIGSKNTFAGGAVRLNLSAFYYNYKGLQLSRIVARTSVNDNTDAGIYGAEAEAVFKPAPDFLLNLTGSYLHTKIKGLSLVDPRDPSGGRSDAVIIKDLQGGANCVVTPAVAGVPAAAVNGFVGAVNGALGLNAPVPIPSTNTTGAFSLCSALQGAAANPNALLRAAFGVPTGPLPFIINEGVAQDLTGNELPQSPKWKVGGGAQYTLRFGNGMTLVPRADVNYTGSFYARSFNRPIDKVKGFTVINAQLQLNGVEDRWFVRAFVQNLTNNEAITGQFVADASSGLFTNVFTLEPRRFGMAIGAKF
ncbi:TonB-dependent receptor [Sphingomonas sp. KRR8]|uniref:TonB-dependent receptor n=1 Tax=Sphingomonas sp. KRR8 TaxID=2942996 RepID=UPI00202053EE|nr:TonB-dependent receptor [Sphingomonas sp. KRR8]URD60859.1 TonB-dependent receptor [Sphingomonas sp. KRR8]